MDDHEIVRDGLIEILERSGDFEIVAQAEDGEEAVAKAQSVEPDVIIMDVFMPLKNGIDACREITAVLPGARALMVTVAREEDAVMQAVAAGAIGYLRKDYGKEKFLATLRDVAAGEYRIPSDMMRRVFNGIRAAAQQVGPEEIARLETREREILTLFVQGQSFDQIAQTTGKRPLTIRNTFYGIQHKIGAKTKLAMVVWAVRSGLLDPPPADG